MPFASKSVEKAIAKRFHSAECACEGRLSACPAYAKAYCKQVKNGRKSAA